MRSLRSFLVAFFLVALLLAASSAALGAASPNEVSGTITVDPNTNTGSVAVVEFKGSLVGPATEVYTAASKDGKTILHGMGSFTGTFEGTPVSFTYRFNGHTEGETLVGQITIDPLSGVQGHFSFEGVGNDFTYDGLIVL
jgi:hypothetical protein